MVAAAAVVAAEDAAFKASNPAVSSAVDAAVRRSIKPADTDTAGRSAAAPSGAGSAK